MFCPQEGCSDLVLQWPVPFLVEDGKDSESQSEQPSEGHCYRKKKTNVHVQIFSKFAQKTGQGGRILID